MVRMGQEGIASVFVSTLVVFVQITWTRKKNQLKCSSSCVEIY